MSDPSSSGTYPAASAAAEPPEEPPGVRSRSQGLFVVPYMTLKLCQSAMAVARFVFPRITAPAPFKRATAIASSAGRQSRPIGSPQVVGRPPTLKDSLTVIGIPSNGRRSPRANAASASAAEARARSKIAHDNRVDPRIMLFDSSDRVFQQLRRGDFSRIEHRAQFADAAIGQASGSACGTRRVLRNRGAFAPSGSSGYHRTRSRQKQTSA
jgi:hypothetical protein